MWSSRPYTFDRVVRIFFTAVVACIILYFLYTLRHVLLPFFAACLFAYIIDPLVRWNQRIFKIKSHTWAVVLTTFEGFLGLAIFCLILIPIVTTEFDHLSLLLHHYVKDVNPELGKFPAMIHDFLHSHFDMEKVIAEVERLNMTRAVDSIWNGVTSGLAKILGLLGWLISIVYVIFILLDFDRYKSGIKKLIPNKYMPAVSAVSQDVSWSMKRYFRNQALISFIVGICYAIGFSIVGIPMAVVIGMINMILFMVPYLVYVSVVPVIVMCVFKSMEAGVDFWIVLMECGVVYIVVEVFADMVLTPHIMGKALGMNPALILLSLSIWGTLLGLLGMIIALPVTTIIIKWTKIALTNWRNSVNRSSSPPPDAASGSATNIDPPRIAAK